MKMLQLFLDAFFPKTCIGCKAFGDYICINCLQKVTQKDLVCCICKEPSPTGITDIACKDKLGLDGIWSLGAYEGVLKEAIHKLKYNLVYDLAQDLVDFVVIYCQLKNPYFQDEIKKDKDRWVVVPVPLYKTREWKRGFNQSAILAKILAKKIALPYKSILSRLKDTNSQTKLKKMQRGSNVKNAFSLSANYQLLTTNCLLVDDVWTTGCTLLECAKVLKKAGADKVWGITIAH